MSENGIENSNIKTNGSTGRSLSQSLSASLISAFVTAVVLFFLTGKGSGDTITLGLSVLFALAGGGIVFGILRSGRVNGFRLGLFVILGIVFTIAFSIEHEVHRGSILLTHQTLSTTGAPICPITIPFVAVPYALLGRMIFPTAVASLFSVLFLWLAFIVVLGRGWCGWACFFGWMDQFFASLLKKPLVKLENPPRWAKLFPYALMLFLILAGLVLLEPVFCAYLCPLRIIYDPPAVATTFDWITALIFVTGGLAFFVVGPLVTKKRLFCSYVCPLMPANAIVGVVSPFKVKVDKDKCKDCGACIRKCELSAITQESLAKGAMTIECAKCGRCMDACPQGAIDYKLIGTNAGIRPWFVSLAVISSVIFASGFIAMIVQFLLTGTIGTF